MVAGGVEQVVGISVLGILRRQVWRKEKQMVQRNTKRDTPLSVKLEDGELVIRVGIDTLAFAVSHGEDTPDPGDVTEDQK